jgi:hypothetical protein
MKKPHRNNRSSFAYEQDKTGGTMGKMEESKELESLDDIRMHMIEKNLATIVCDLELIKEINPTIRKCMNNYAESMLMAVSEYFGGERKNHV